MEDPSSEYILRDPSHPGRDHDPRISAPSGKYGPLCTIVRLDAQAEAAVLIVVGGKFGTGYSVQTSNRVDSMLPGLLRQLADMIEEGTA